MSSNFLNQFTVLASTAFFTKQLILGQIMLSMKNLCFEKPPGLKTSAG